MIAKKIKRSNGNQSKLVNVRNLIEYINAPYSKNAEEKLLFSGTRGFVFDDLEIQKKEMLALVHCNVRSPNPVMHYLLSWKEGEQPTREQCEEAIDIFIEETGLTNNQIMWGVHHNTKNIHMHIATNKIDLDTEKITRINNNLDLEILHKVIAKIEHKQGWESTPNSRYICDDEGNLLRANSKKILEPIALKALAIEAYYGDKSAIRIAQEKAVDIIKSSKSWDELHQKLDDVGMIYQKKGSGAVIKVKDTFIKASSVSRDFSLKQMEKRLGAFEESAYLIPTLGGLAETTNFLTMVSPQIQRQEQGKKEIPSQAPIQSTGQSVLAHAQPYKQLRHSPLASKSQQASDKQSSSNAQPKIVPFPQCPMMMTGKAPAKLTPRQQKMRKKKKKLPSLLPRLVRACGGVENFLHTDCPEYGGSRLNKEHIKLWFQYQDARFRKKQEKIVHEIQISFGITTEKKSFGMPKFTEWLKANHPDKLDSWRYERIQNYITNDDTKESYVISFFDKVERKLGELAQAGWKKISIHGSDFFKQLVMRLSFKHHLKITNPELQESLIKTEEEYNKIDSMKEMQSFLAYHKGIQADKYRIIYKITDDTQSAFILDRQYHVNGFTPEQLQERIQEMLKLQSEGNTIYIRPISESKYYILVDNMSRANLEEFLLDGYKPSVILEKGHDNYQAVITVPKLGAMHDDAVGDRVAKRLQLLYGGEKRNGNIDTRPLLHRMPAFQNHAHKQADGTCSTVQLIQSEQIECPRTYRLAEQFNMQYEANRKTSDYTYSKFNELIAKQNNTHYTSYEAENSANTAYFKHLNNIRSHLDVIDKSRVDVMIAVRMRATGHSQASIEGAIKDCAREWREPNERKSWDDYARRTAEYAFSYSGNLDMLRNKQQHKQWFSVEGKIQNTNKMNTEYIRLKT